LRKKCPLQTHAVWQELPGRTDPVTLLRQSSNGRIPELIPIRYGRMLQASPCPCGVGNKYKKCCIGKAQAAFWEAEG